MTWQYPQSKEKYRVESTEEQKNERNKRIRMVIHCHNYYTRKHDIILQYMSSTSCEMDSQGSDYLQSIFYSTKKLIAYANTDMIPTSHFIWKLFKHLQPTHAYKQTFTGTPRILVLHLQRPRLMLSWLQFQKMNRTIEHRKMHFLSLDSYCLSYYLLHHIPSLKPSVAYETNSYNLEE